MKKLFTLLLPLLAVLFPSLALACACGCGVFDVGTGAMWQTEPGGMAWLETDYMDQHINWSGSNAANAANNPDKTIRTQFFTAGAEYAFDRDWGASIEVPYWNRYFNTTNDNNVLEGYNHAALGDVRIKGIYTGLDTDMSTGLTFGLKLPTGDNTYPYFDSDSEIGTGSTDILLGGYHMGRLTSDNKYSWFVSGQWDQPVLTQNHYRPGEEIDLATGVYYDAGDLVKVGKLSPVLSLIGSDRHRDSGDNADPYDSGYTRLLIAPGLEYDYGHLRLYGDVELPVYQNVNGNQLTAPELFKFIVGYSF